jgi:hypothetical protein
MKDFPRKKRSVENFCLEFESEPETDAADAAVGSRLHDRQRPLRKGRS